ncbi:protein of unknown function [Cupriavidus taiwanensis]|uniref:Uncharacterized protein n=1 Tax=Cupriavidus taiwanensis TaxID=164546 RepID=A0A9Q7UTP4_9BURK|nr:protein of unknown function [Cupriavidus taiwanensis]
MQIPDVGILQFTACRPLHTLLRTKKKHPETDIVNPTPRASPHQAAVGCPKPHLCPILPCSAPAPATLPRRPGRTAQHPPSTEA